jgi:two-component system cell cycle sensor histidine kinase/response regulator CckA
MEESEDRTIVEQPGAGNAQADPATGQFTRVDAAFCQITGYTEEELLTLTFYDITHPDDRERDLEIARPVFCGECDQWQSEKRYLRKDGCAVRVLVTGRLIRDEAGRPFRTVASIRDITGREPVEGNSDNRSLTEDNAGVIRSVG